MLRGFFGNLIFAIIARMLCGNHLNGIRFTSFVTSKSWCSHDVVHLFVVSASSGKNRFCRLVGRRPWVHVPNPYNLQESSGAYFLWQLAGRTDPSINGTRVFCELILAKLASRGAQFSRPCVEREKCAIRYLKESFLVRQDSDSHSYLFSLFNGRPI